MTNSEQSATRNELRIRFMNIILVLEAQRDADVIGKVMTQGRCRAVELRVARVVPIQRRDIVLGHDADAEHVAELQVKAETAVVRGGRANVLLRRVAAGRRARADLAGSELQHGIDPLLMPERTAELQ